MDDGTIRWLLGAMAAAIVAVWGRMTALQTRLETLIRDEADCRSKLTKLQESIDTKHEENQAAIAALYCKEKDK